MIQDFKNQITVFEADASGSVTAKSAKKLFIYQEKIWKKREKFFAILVQ